MIIWHQTNSKLSVFAIILLTMGSITATTVSASDDWPGIATANIAYEQINQSLVNIWKNATAVAAVILDGEASSRLFVAAQELDHDQREALQNSLDKHNDELSMRFFHFLWSNSPFPKSYAYLFIFLVLTIAIKFMELPFLIKTAKFSLLLPSLRDDIQFIQNTYRDDPPLVFQKTQQLFQENGISSGSGCAVFTIDLIFVIWALISLSNYSPQFSLDGSKFLDIVPDVTKYSFWVVIFWISLSFLTFLMTSANNVGPSPGQLSCGWLLNAIFIIGISWYWDWPAYIFIFWSMLVLFGLLLYFIITGFMMTIK